LAWSSACTSGSPKPYAVAARAAALICTTR
jgi:hypothetical protein